MSLIQGLRLESCYIEARAEGFSFIIEGTPQYVRMANLACIGSRRVNGVAEVSLFGLSQDFKSDVFDSCTVSSSGPRS